MKLELKNYNIISVTKSIETSTIIFGNDSRVFYIKENSEKILDIINMPFYIKDDWFDENKKEIDLAIINQEIGIISNYLNNKTWEKIIELIFLIYNKNYKLKNETFK